MKKSSGRKKHNTLVARGVVTFSGSVVGLTFGTPNVIDIAVQCMRQARFAGSLREWWPVGMHQMLTANIVKEILGAPELILDCLLHDCPESVFGDTPSPLKTDQRRRHENELLSRVYQSLNIDLPTDAQHVTIKEADTLALAAEAAELGHQEFTSLIEEICRRNNNDEKVAHACNLMRQLYSNFSPLEAINSNGRHVNDYLNRMFKHILYRLRQAT